MTCEYCGKSVGLLRRLRGTPFCSDAHAEAHRHELDHGLLMSLLKPTILGAAVSAPEGGVPAAPPRPLFPPAPPGHDEELASLAGVLLRETFSDGPPVSAFEPLPVNSQPLHVEVHSDPDVAAPPVCPFLIEAPADESRCHRREPRTPGRPIPSLGPIAFPETLALPATSSLTDAGVFNPASVQPHP